MGKIAFGLLAVLLLAGCGGDPAPYIGTPSIGSADWIEFHMNRAIETFIALVYVVLISLFFRYFTQKVTLPMADEIRKSTKQVFDKILAKSKLTNEDRNVLSRLVIGYGIYSGLLFFSYVFLLANLSTPHG